MYFLTYGEKVQYVGQTVQPDYRPHESERNVQRYLGLKVDGVFIVDTPPAERRALEEAYIVAFDPPGNIDMRSLRLRGKSFSYAKRGGQGYKLATGKVARRAA